MQAIVQQGRVFVAARTPESAIRALVGEAVRSQLVERRKLVSQFLVEKAGDTVIGPDYARDARGGVSGAASNYLLGVVQQAAAEGVEAFQRELLTAAANLPTEEELAARDALRDGGPANG